MKEVYQKVLDNIPDYKAFLTVDELEESSRQLAAEYPDLCEIFSIGHTKDGRDLPCLKIKGGKHIGLMFGCPHPNEPIGTMMLEYLTRTLCENEEFRNELDYTWYFVKAWDADGLKLNEKWLKGPYTIYNYTRNFFRPAGHKQVDWTFPIDYKEMHFHDVTPEAEAMMGLIEKIRPEFIFSLHNAGFGGAYWYISGGDEELFEKLRETAKKVGVPLNLGEPEAPECVELSPAVYEELSIRQSYDYIEKFNPDADMASIMHYGTNSADYAEQLCGSFTLLAELPYFYDERINDNSEADILRKDSVLNKLTWGEESSAKLRKLVAEVDPYLNPEDPFILAIKAFTRGDSNEATKAMIATNPDYQRKATVAEAFDNDLVAKFYKDLSYGMMIRACEDELERMDAGCEAGPTDESGEKRRVLDMALNEAEKMHWELTDYLEKNIKYQVVPIWKLISIQLTSGLLVAEYLKNRA
ncbi:MAG: zinc carboxypeptidase [Firmicutes bacterium]|nr:zinc carboxypeptidase [Bacillota bacterium]